MACDPVLERRALAALAAGRAIRGTVPAMPPAERGRPAPAALKPAKQIVSAVDRAAEVVGLANLERLRTEIGCPIALVADAARDAAHRRRERRRRAGVRDARCHRRRRRRLT